MNRITVVIKRTETSTFDIGDIPVGLIKALLAKNDGTFDGTWGLWDLDRDTRSEVESIEIIESK